jgi:hypothetical protein
LVFEVLVADLFNPYSEWLGVQSTAAKPNHYELLGLAPYESKPEVITAAANTQMAKVRSVRPGSHIDEWRQLLDELEIAKRCLLDAEKSRYDDLLRAKGWPSANPAILKRPVAKPGSNAATGTSRSSTASATSLGAAKAGKENWQPGTNLLPPSRQAAAQKPQQIEPAPPASKSNSPAPATEVTDAKQPAAPAPTGNPSLNVQIQLPRPFPLLPMPGTPHPAGLSPIGTPPGAGAVLPSSFPQPQAMEPANMQPMDLRATGALPANLMPSAMQSPQLSAAGPFLQSLPLPGGAVQPSPAVGANASAPVAFPQSPVLPRPTAAEPIYPQPVIRHPQAAAPNADFFDDMLKESAETEQSPLEHLGIPEPISAGYPSENFETSAEESHEFEGASSRRRTSASRKQGPQIGLLIAGAVVLVGGAVAAAMFLKAGRNSTVAVADNSATSNAVADSNATKDHERQTPASKTAVASDRPDGDSATSRPGKRTAVSDSARANELVGTQVRPPVNTPPRHMTETKTAIADPVKSARLNHLLVDVHHKLGERDQTEARQLIIEAKTFAVTPEQVDRVARLSTLVKYVGEFWAAVRDALRALKVADEIDVGTTKVIVVESDKQSLTIHMGSGNHHFEFKELPSGLAIALANRWLDPNKPANKVFVGAFCAVDPKLPDGPGDARRLWSEAAAAGVPDGSYLLPLLDAQSESLANDDALPAVPAAEAVEQATQKIKSEFASAITAAATPRQVDSLVQKLFDAADSSDEPVRRYALCIQARDLAAKAGRAKMTIDAIDRIARDFHIDSLDVKADTFANNPPQTPAAGREMARAALKLVDEAVAANRIALATRLAQTAVSAANHSESRELIRRAKQRSGEIEALGGKKMAADPR